jgi:hypothetical protein
MQVELDCCLGETIQTDIWRNEAQVHFRCLVKERGVVVLSLSTASIGIGNLVASLY